ncbi:MAG: hypothetical protein ABIT58_00170 [Ferruginibacter sp.]
MKKPILFSITMFVCVLSYGQINVNYGDAFDFKTTEEKEPKLILTDSYNAYLLSYINIDGILSNHEIIVRKFDQKNQLIDSYKVSFPKIDQGTLYNFVGAAAMPGNNKELIFTESYSGKAGKQDLYQHIFDKSTGAFTTTLLKSFPMESVNKKGVFQFSISENNRFIAILNVKNSSKKEAVQNTVLMLDVATAGLVWTKDVELDVKNYERSLTVTNSGKAVLVRGAKGLKLYNFLTVVFADNAANKELGEEVQLQTPGAVTIGNKDYLIGFDHDAKGLRAGDFEKFMLYDLEEGKMIGNNKMSVLNTVKEAMSVEIRNVFIQDNEFHIFVEAKVRAGTRPVKVNQFSTTTFDEPYYKYGPGVLIVMDFEGKIKNTVKLNVNNNSLAEIYPSFGVINVRGDYMIIGSGAEIYKLSPAENFKINAKSVISFRSSDISPESTTPGSWDMVPHLFAYLGDSKRFLIARYSNNKMSLITVGN